MVLPFMAWGIDYSLYNPAQKRQVYLAVQFAQALKLVLETPLLTKEGGIDNRCFKALEAGKQVFSPKIKFYKYKLLSRIFPNLFCK